MENTKNTEDCGIFQFSISRTVCTLLKLGNGGKLDSFLLRVIKTLKKEIVLLNKNLDTLKFNHEQTLDELNDKLDDAQESLQNSYFEINVDKIATNESQKAYEEVYLENIDRHQAVVKNILTKIQETKDSYEVNVLDLEEEIASRQTRIDTISAK